MLLSKNSAEDGWKWGEHKVSSYYLGDFVSYSVRNAT